MWWKPAMAFVITIALVCYTWGYANTCL